MLVKATEFYQMCKKDPTLRVGLEIITEAMADNKKYETPLDAIIAHGEDQAHRFFDLEDFERIIEKHLLMAPVGVDRLTALGKFLAFGALALHQTEGYMEITELGWKVGASYLIGKTFDPEEKERAAEERKRQSELRAKRWEARKQRGKEAVDAYVFHGGSLQEAIDALVDMKGGSWEDTEPREDGWWGTYSIEEIVKDAWDLAAEQPAPDFDYSMKAPFRDEPSIPGQDYSGKIPRLYRPDLIEIFMPLWDGLVYYIPGWPGTDKFHREVSYYDWNEQSLLEQSFVHYMKTGNPQSLRVAHNMVDALIERLLDSDKRYFIYSYLSTLESALNRIGHYLNGYSDQYLQITCQFMRDILDRWPFLQEEIPVVDRESYLLEDFKHFCE